MGDGGVVCAPLQRTMGRFPVSDTFCRGNGGFSLKSIQFAESQLQRKHDKKMVIEKEELGQERAQKEELEKGELRLGRVENGEVEKCEIAPAKLPKDEVEEGELGSLKGSKGEVENGEFVPEKLRKREVEKGEFVSGKWRRGEVEKEEFYARRGRRSEIEKGEFIPEKWRRGEVEKTDYSSWKGRKGEVEKGEFIPEKWRKGELVKDENGLAKSRKWEVEKDDFSKKGWKCEQDRTPPTIKFSEEDASHSKASSRSESERRKRSSRWDPGYEKDSRISSRIADEEQGSYKHEYSNGRDYSSGTWLKRHDTESESSSRKYHGESSDYPGSKSRRLSDDTNRSGYPEKQYSRSSMERSYRNSTSSRGFPSSRYSSRHHESSLSSRVVHDRHGRSPGYSERSPHDRARYYDHRDRSPLSHSERIPHDRARYDRRNRSPTHAERSPHDRSRPQDRRDRTPGYLEQSTINQGRSRDYRETSRKGGGNERQHNRYGDQELEEKLGQRDSGVRDSHLHSSTRQPQDNRSLQIGTVSVEKNPSDQSHKEEQSQNLGVGCKEPPSQLDGASEELFSMEEDMDICDTPPHVPVMTDSILGKWVYLDHFGVEQGPSKLCDLKRLVEEGVLMSDHLIKHSNSDRWETVENAASPLATVNFPHIVSDTITQLVSPPEAPGNLLADIGDAGQSVNQHGQELSVTLPQPLFMPDDISVAQPLEDLHIDERVGALLRGYTVVPGKELEIIGEVLNMTFEHAEWEKWGRSEGFTRSRLGTGEYGHQTEDEFSRVSEITSKEAAESRLTVTSDKDYSFVCGDSSDWFSGRWSCKGGDWKRNDEAAQDRSCKKKLALNDSYPLCQMPKSGYEDPRWHRKDELYYPSQSRRLDLPQWAFSWPEESKSSQTKPLAMRGVKGNILPVVRINACVVKDHGPFVSEHRMKVKGNERHSSRSVRSFSASIDGNKLLTESASRSKKVNEQDLQGFRKCITPINTPKDRVCTVDELQLHLGDWYFLDGAGHEHGPLSFSKLQSLVGKGIIQDCSSVFRKVDNVWVPVASAAQDSEAIANILEENMAPPVDSSAAPLSQSQIVAHSGKSIASSPFHSLHPQFIGYTRGKLQELVMKSYKSREFAAAINEVLDPWINAKQPKKELDKHLFTSVITKSSLSHGSMMHKFRKSEDDVSGIYKDHILAGKRARILVDGSEEDYEMEEDLLKSQKDDYMFEDLCGEATFVQESSANPEAEKESWGLLNGHILARVFHFLRADIKSLTSSASTCKWWNAAVKFYKDISRQVDLSFAGPNCTDSMFGNIMKGYNKEKINSVVLIGCTNISPGALEEILYSFPCISFIDIRGCCQFRELIPKFQNVKWIKSRSSHTIKIFEDSHSKIRSLKQITEKSSSIYKAFKGSSSHLDDPSEPGESFDRNYNLDRRHSMSQSFRRNFYKRTKLFDARRSSSLLSREAHMKHWLRRKSGNGYKRMEEFLSCSLKDIMKANTFDFFVPKVAEIEDRMNNGYYIGHGLTSVKEDISRMCRDAIKAKNRGDTGDMNHIVTLFMQLVTSLEENSKSSNERDEMMKTLKDGSPSGFTSAASKYKKKHSKIMSERKCINRSNGTSYVNGGTDDGEYVSDREIRRRLSKLNKRALDSGSETSDDLDRSSEGARGDSESTVSDTQSDLDSRSEGGIGNSRGNGYSTADEVLDSVAEDREWGARMTKASLVPPVTRKYEVIDRYCIVADEEEVQRKMRVSLPEDYAEKLNAQKSGTEDSDMEIPEVKDYKPRKQVGDEVLEQEVYGIDPYTHNLLLDSMPEELHWPPLEKHMFIEDVLLRALNKQARRFTGTGNTPMIYPLQPVVEEIQKLAEEGSDTRILKMCQGILKAMDSRRADNYVSYRKGLGVVCNKEEGFGEDDFVVEFLGEVYPAWRWFEKQDGIRSLQKNNKDPAPEFYNIYLERPKGDGDGYDLVVVDAMHKANYASRICHSCRPNCEAKCVVSMPVVTAVDGQYQIGIYSVRPIGYGEEITFDYNSVTESKEEYEASVVCVAAKFAGELFEFDWAGLGSCLLDGLPDWLIAYSARLVRFINFERTKLPEEIQRHNLEEKRKFFLDIFPEVEKSDAEVQAEGVYNQRLQNLALTLDKVRYVMRCVFGDPRKAPPPLEKLSPKAAVSILWNGEESLVEELLQCMAPHMEEALLK
ncbi:hypothetical protein HHK36_032009 [Tetracentron sinense]|uniref:SET domain-containing protein n=1 Tax=Tetracentron sinense TaxID=13715 RepID=A0A835CY18_TETSI|nr:hypothetical protein HHK36_032009 [Tetracentron sinense]